MPLVTLMNSNVTLAFMKIEYMSHKKQTNPFIMLIKSK